MSMQVMALPVVEFPREENKIRKKMAKNQPTQFDFESQFSMSKIIRIFLIFFPWKNTALFFYASKSN